MAEIGETEMVDANPMSERKRTVLAALMLLGIFLLLVLPFLGGIGVVEIVVWAALLVGVVWVAIYLRSTRRRESDPSGSQLG